MHEFTRYWVKLGNDITVVTSVYSRSDFKASKLIEGQIMGGTSGIKIGFEMFTFNVFPAYPFFNSDIRELDFLNWFFSHEILNSKNN